jgi:hypothetical protein
VEPIYRKQLDIELFVKWLKIEPFCKTRSDYSLF